MAYSNIKEEEAKPIEFSPTTKKVFESGRNLWRYYHSLHSENEKEININASLYDIKEYFQKRNEKGRMNATSSDEKYTRLLSDLKKSVDILALKIQPKVYKYGFLKE